MISCCEGLTLSPKRAGLRPAGKAYSYKMSEGGSQMKRDTDVVVIGGGPGGTPAAMRLASSGKKVLLVEKSGRLGGACLFVGCIPSKIIRHSADEYAQLLRTSLLKSRILDSREEVWRDIRLRMDRILTMRSNAALQNLDRTPGLAFLPGTARFVSPHEVEIEDPAGERTGVHFGTAIVSTGSQPKIPAFRGDGAADVLTSDTLFVRDSLPDSMAIIGGGPIGVELAQMLSKLQVKCIVIELMTTILPGAVEPEFASLLTEAFLKSNIAVETSARVLEIQRAGGGFRTSFVDAKGMRRTLETEQVLVATGRSPNVGDLNLDAADIRHTPNGIAVDEFLRTSGKGIYATGDVMGGPKFAHTATYEAHLAAANILAGDVHPTDFDKNSWVVFSEPEIATVGFLEAAAASCGFEVTTGTYDYRIDAAAQINEATHGFLKFVVDKPTGRILGIHIFSPDAASLVGEAAMIVSGQLTVRDVARAIHPHPTLTESFGFLASRLSGG
jgi:dihydrolipoamide dehydrogenase